MQTLTIRRPDDFHAHFRTGEMLTAVLPLTAAHFARAIAMPNLKDPVLTAADAARYEEEIMLNLMMTTGPDAPRIKEFKPLMTIQITESTTPEMIREARAIGVLAGKVYPRGRTTNSDNGVLDYKKLAPVYQAMSDCGMRLLLHGESPDPESEVLDREHDFLETLEWISANFPNLMIVLEHVTTKAAVECVMALPYNVAATITVHHLLITLDDVIGDKLQPHLFCKPVAKRREDQKALIAAATSGNPKFFLGTDSAPHPRSDKECSACSAGVFSAPVALAALAEVFDIADALDKLEDFVSRFGAEHYNLPLNEGTITLVKQSWKVPAVYGTVVPLLAGEEVEWRVQT